MSDDDLTGATEPRVPSDWLPRCKKHGIPVGFHSRPGGTSVAVCELCGGECEVAKPAPDDKPKWREIKVKGHTILVDEADYQTMSQYTWNVKKDKNTFYAQVGVWVGGRSTSISMHRILTGMLKKHVDHINHNGLDNRRSNLRTCTNRQNAAHQRRPVGKSGYRGVYRTSGVRNRPWSVSINVSGKRLHVSGFPSPEDAAREYDRLAKIHNGDFAILNFPENK